MNFNVKTSKWGFPRLSPPTDIIRCYFPKALSLDQKYLFLIGGGVSPNFSETST